MRKLLSILLIAMTCVLMSCGNKVRTSVDVDFGKGKFKEPFRGLISSHPQWLVKTLDWPVIRELRPDTVELVKNIEFGFDQGAIASGQNTKLYFEVNDSKGYNMVDEYIDVYCDRKHVGLEGYSLKPTTSPVSVKIKYKISPRLGKREFHGSIKSTGAVISSINGKKIQYTPNQPIVNVTFEQKIGWPLILWIVWFLILLVMIAVAVLSVYFTVEFIMYIVEQHRLNKEAKRLARIKEEEEHQLACAQQLEDDFLKNSLQIKPGIFAEDRNRYDSANEEYEHLKAIKDKISNDKTNCDLRLEYNIQHLRMFYMFVVPESTNSEVAKVLINHNRSAKTNNQIDLRFPHLNNVFNAKETDIEDAFNNVQSIFKKRNEEFKKTLDKIKFSSLDNTAKGSSDVELEKIVNAISEECLGTLTNIDNDLNNQLDSVRSIAFVNLKFYTDLTDYICYCLKNSKQNDTACDDIISDVKDIVYNLSYCLKGNSQFLVSCGIKDHVRILRDAFGDGLIQKINNHEKLTEKKNCMDKVSDIIYELHDIAMKCIDMGNSMVEVNEKFTTVYEPLAKKIYIGKNYTPTCDDLEELCNVIKKYAKICKPN